uniref:Ig-like domain-containing protein n=1 Tax=Oreochromis niloticus TaxID=8128 RepID=A0A669CUM5_ORENI
MILLLHSYPVFKSDVINHVWAQPPLQVPKSKITAVSLRVKNCLNSFVLNKIFSVAVYRERIGKNSSVVFNPAVYTDTGVYELRCGDRRVDVQVKVVMSSERCVSEGDAVSLPCYFSTTGKARWSRNSWEVTGAAEGRLSLSPDWVSHGNFSLTLKQAQKDDQGDYFCYIQDEVVIAVRLTVTGQRSLDQSSSTLTNDNNDHSHILD